jgi:hypothetical protein
MGIYQYILLEYIKDVSIRLIYTQKRWTSDITHISSSFNSNVVKINLPSFQIGSFGAHHNLARFCSIDRENSFKENSDTK